MWGNAIPSDVLEIIFRNLETTASLAAVASTNRHWRATAHGAASAWKVCAHRTPYNTDLKTIESYLHFVQRAPKNSVRDLLFEVDIPSCPNREGLAACIDRLRDVIVSQKDSLRRVSLRFLLCPIIPSILRSLVIHPAQPSFFKLARTLESLRGLDILQLQGALMPVFIRKSVNLHVTSTVVDLYPEASKWAPSAFISRLLYSAHRKVMRGHMIFKIRTKHHPEGDFGHHVISDYVYNNVLPFQYTNRGNTCNIKLNHTDVHTHAPGMILFILCMRATNYVIFDKGLSGSDDLRWKRVFGNHRDLGFFCERLPLTLSAWGPDRTE